MSPLQLYTFQLCPFAHRVRLTLAEKRLAAELIEIDLKNKPAGFSKISPYGKVPLLQHGDVKIWESTIINEYLDEVFSDTPLMPPLAVRSGARPHLDQVHGRTPLCGNAQPHLHAGRGGETPVGCPDVRQYPVS